MNNIKCKKRRYEIENFEPYNDISNGRCFYRALFSVLKHFNVDVMNLLCNNVYHYGLVHDREDGVSFDYLGLNEKPGIGYDKLLTKSGIRMTGYCNVKDVINRIIDSVSKDKPVIIYIDCYYEPIRPDMYMKTHMVHSIVIYGYDMDTSEFLIIEHDYVNGWNYKKRTLSFDDVERCYRGYVDDDRQEDYSYFEFDNDIESEKSWDAKRVLMENYALRSDSIYQGIKELEKFIPNDFINKRKEIESGGEELTFVFNSACKILRDQKVRNYTISTAFQYDPMIKDIINKITNDWFMTMSLIYKFKLSPAENRVFSFERCVSNLNNILSNEKIIHERILQYCNIALNSQEEMVKCK